MTENLSTIWSAWHNFDKIILLNKYISVFWVALTLYGKKVHLHRWSDRERERDRVQRNYTHTKGNIEFIFCQKYLQDDLQIFI